MSAKDVRSFLGMSGYYRQTIYHYADIAEPLVTLTRKRIPFVWTGTQQNAFDALKNMLLSDSVMAFPQTDRPYILYTDASDLACGVILCQLDQSGTE